MICTFLRRNDTITLQRIYLYLLEKRMTHKERFFATIARNPVDKPASWLGLPTSDALPGLFAHFRVNSVYDLKEKLGDDVHAIEVPFESPVGNQSNSMLKNG